MKFLKFENINIATLIVAVFYLTLLIWWAFIQFFGVTDSSINYLYAFFYGVLPAVTGIYCFIKSLKQKDNIKFTIMFFSLGLFFWGVGEFIWTYYNLILQVAVPYPSFADALFIMSYPMWTIAIFFTARLVGLDITVKGKFFKFFSAIFILLVILFSYYFIYKSLAVQNSENLLKLFFDIVYPVWDIILIVLILLINALSMGYIKGRLQVFLIFVTAGLIANFIADIGFVYQTAVSTFFNGNITDFFYTNSLSFISFGITLLLSDNDNSVISNQSLLLKQKEEELSEANVKLHERDELLSRINKELYKKNMELVEEKRKAEALLYNINEAVIVLDTNANIVLFNRSAQNLIGLREDEVSGKKYDEVIVVVDEHSAVVSSDRIKESLGYRQGSKLSNLILKRSDAKERYVNLTASKVPIDKDINLYVLIITDVTEEKHAEKAREEFISIASHELRTPMTIIKNYLWMLQNKKGGDITPKQNEYIEKAMQGTERMIKLIHDMLDVSRMEQGRMEFHPTQVDIASLLAEVSSDFKIKADQKGLQLSLNIPSNLPKVRADADKLREVIVNLVGNSMKYADKGFVRVEAIEDGKNVKVSVVDSGKGISVEDVPKLFHKFGRLDNSFVTAAESGGTGLGLYIVKSIVEAMGGKVGVMSEGVGKGSTFWFTLRAASATDQV